MESLNLTLKNNLKIHTLVKGDPSKPALVLVHGWPSSGLLWRHMIPELSKHFYVLVPDMPGHGKSDKPKNTSYDLPFLRNFILDYFDALDLKTASLAAHDLGGMAALSFAVRHPDRLEKFIIMNTSPFPEWSFRLHLTIYLLKQKNLAWFFLNPYIFKHVLKDCFYNKKMITPEVIDIFRAPWIHSKSGHRAFSKTIEIPPELMVEPEENLKKITTPTLILWGKNDVLFPLKTARRLHKLIKFSSLVGVNKAGHFLQEEQPEFVQQQLISFLKE